MKIQRYIKITLTLLLITTFSANAQVYTENEFSAWDADNNEYIDDNEFNTVFEENEWYDEWDADRDGLLSEEEWNDGLVTNYPAYTPDDYGTYADWDLNDNDVVEEDEWQGYTFDMWDEDDDGYITAEEYDAIYDDDM